VQRRGPHLDRPDDHLIDQATHELRSAGLVHDEPILAGHVVRAPRCYPVYLRGYREQVGRLADYLRNFRGLTPIGRMERSNTTTFPVAIPRAVLDVAPFFRAMHRHDHAELRMAVQHGAIVRAEIDRFVRGQFR